MSMLIYPAYSLFLLTMSLWCFVSQRKHLSMILLSLEMIVLSMSFMFFLSLSGFYREISFSLFFLTFSVYEGSSDLSILVSTVRSYGNDYLGSVVMLRC